TFERCRLDWEECTRHAEALTLHRDLLQLRRTDAVLRAQKPRGLDGAVLAPQALCLRFFADDGADRLLGVKLGRELQLVHVSEPLLAPPPGCEWGIHWSSDDVRYGGCATPPLETPEGWRLPGEAAVLLIPQVKSERPENKGGNA